MVPATAPDRKWQPEGRPVPTRNGSDRETLVPHTGQARSHRFRGLPARKAEGEERTDETASDNRRVRRRLRRETITEEKGEWNCVTMMLFLFLA